MPKTRRQAQLTPDLGVLDHPRVKAPSKTGREDVRDERGASRRARKQEHSF